MQRVDPLQQALGCPLDGVRHAAAGLRLAKAPEQHMQASELAMQPDRRAAHGADALRPVMQPVDEDVVLDGVRFVEEADHGVGDVVDDVFDDLFQQRAGAADSLAAVQGPLRSCGWRAARRGGRGRDEIIADDPAERADILGFLADFADQVVETPQARLAEWSSR